jgi:hypothetical protein
MKNTKEQGPMENLIQGLDEQSNMLSPEEASEELTARGVNVENLLRKADSLIKSSLKAERTAWMGVADKRRAEMQAAGGALKTWVGRAKEEILAAWEALASEGKESFAFRNKADLSIDDKARILDDLERLKANVPEPPDSAKE